MAATEALALFRADDFRRFRNRIDPTTDLQASAAVCCEVLAAIAMRRGEAERAAALLGQAGRLRDESGVEVPAFQREDRDRAESAARAALGPAGFRAAYDEGAFDGVQVASIP